MKITGLKIHIFSSQHKNAKRNWLIVRLFTDEGIEGIGESSMLSNDLLVESLLEDWVQNYLIGKDPMSHELHWTRLHLDNMDKGGRLFSTALSGIDIALWDLKGKILNSPVYSLLGGPYQEKIRVYANGWYTVERSPQQFSEAALNVIEKGYIGMKFDPFGNGDLEMEREEFFKSIDLIEAVSSTVGHKAQIMLEMQRLRINKH